jgi:hypothetical protein
MYFYNSTKIHSSSSYKTSPSLPRPRVVPAILRRGLGLYSCVLDWHTIPDALLQHCNSEQLAHLVALCFTLAQLKPLLRGQAVCIDEAKSLTCTGHAVVLPFEIELVLHAEFRLVELPCAVDGPVAEGAVAGVRY